MENNIIEVYHFEMEQGFEQNHVNPMHLIMPEELNIKDLIEKGLYQKVAIVNSENLDEAFQLTNHIDVSWTENKNVKTLQEKVRSTSVGDLMIKENSVYIIEAIGFKKMVEQNPGEIKKLLDGQNNMHIKKNKI